MLYTIKTIICIQDLTHESADMGIPENTVIENAEDEGDYFIVGIDGWSYPIMKDECIILNEVENASN